MTASGLRAVSCVFAGMCARRERWAAAAQDTPRVRCTRVNYAGRRVPLLRVAVCACRAAPVWASWGARGFVRLLYSGAWWRVRGGRNAKPHAVPPEGGGGHGGVWGSRDRRCHVRGTSPVGHASVTRIGNGSPVLAPRPRADPLSSPPVAPREFADSEGVVGFGRCYAWVYLGKGMLCGQAAGTHVDVRFERNEI